MKILAVCLLVLLVSTTHAEVSPERIDALASEAQAQVVEWRRWFHQNPELGNREFNTSKRLAEILRGMGLEPKTGIAHTGLTALIEGGKPGPLVAIRTDIDALPSWSFEDAEVFPTARGLSRSEDGLALARFEQGVPQAGAGARRGRTSPRRGRARRAPRRRRDRSTRRRRRPGRHRRSAGSRAHAW